MTIHTLHARQLVSGGLDDVFGFFAEPRNLARITPSSMGFEFLTDDFEMRAGLEIKYRLRALPGLPVTWRTQITEFDPPNSFADVQAQGPYRRWDHRHTFTEVEGGTLVEDRVEYEMPFGAVGAIGHRLVVQDELSRIFRHRARTIARIFEQPLPNKAPRTVAVAGGTGFVGGAIARELHRRGNRVVVLSHRGEAARGGLPDDVELRTADATGDHRALVDALRGVYGLVIALAFPNLPVEAPRRGRTFEAVDAQGTESLVAAAREAGVERIIYISGAGAAADAERHWFRAKWRAEQATRSGGMTWTIVRPTWIYGPDDVSLNRFVDFARRLPFVPMSNFGSQLLAPVFVDDAARLVADALIEPAADNQVFELGGPETLPMRSVISRALTVAGIDKPILPGPAPLIKLAVAPMLLLPVPPMTPAAIDFVNQPATVDVRPLLERMPRRLTPLDEGLATYLAPDSGPARVSFDAPPPPTAMHANADKDELPKGHGTLPDAA